MPENTPMKMQWITVDGRQTPIVLPQIWNHEKQDWEVTSDQNRLPVDARLTGSIDEQLVDTGKKVTAGVLQRMGGLFIAKHYPYFYVLIRADAPHDYSVKIDFRVEVESKSNPFRFEFTQGTRNEHSTIILTEKIPVYSPDIRIYVENKDEEEHVYDVSITWVAN